MGLQKIRGVKTSWTSYLARLFQYQVQSRFHNTCDTGFIRIVAERRYFHTILKQMSFGYLNDNFTTLTAVFLRKFLRSHRPVNLMMLQSGLHQPLVILHTHES